MLRIGDFSRLAGASVKALRLYHRLGVLRPASVDFVTGYRYYSIDQISRFNEILALKHGGLSLQQIVLLLEYRLTSEQIVSVLGQKLTEVAQKRRELSSQERRLRTLIERYRVGGAEKQAPAVVIKTVELQHIAYTRGSTNCYQSTNQLLSQLFRALREALRGSGVRTLDPLVVIWPDSEDPPANDAVEAAIPVSRPAPVDGIRYRPLERTQLACTLSGRLGLTAAYLRIFDWVRRNGFVCTGEVRELLLGADPLEAPECQLVEIQVAVDSL